MSTQQPSHDIRVILPSRFQTLTISHPTVATAILLLRVTTFKPTATATRQIFIKVLNRMIQIYCVISLTRSSFRIHGMVHSAPTTMLPESDPLLSQLSRTPVPEYAPPEETAKEETQFSLVLKKPTQKSSPKPTHQQPSPHPHLSTSNPGLLPPNRHRQETCSRYLLDGRYSLCHP